MLARRVITETEDGDVAVDYVEAEVARAEKQDWPETLTPALERSLRDHLWKSMAKQGMKPRAIAIMCARAAQSPRHIRRRLRELEREGRQAQSEAG